MASETTSRNLKILFVCEEIFPDNVGGVHTYIYQIAKGLAQKGHKVFVLTRRVNSVLPYYELLDGLNVYRYGFKDYSFSIARQFSCILNIRKEIDFLLWNSRFDVINLHSPQAALGAALSKKSKAIPKIYTFHALQYEEDLLFAKNRSFRWYHLKRYLQPLWLAIYVGLMKLLERKGLKDSGKIIVLSDYTADTIVRVYGIPPDKIIKIPAAADTELFRPAEDPKDARKLLFIPQDRKIVFTVRRLVPRMGLDNLIKSMPIVLKKHPETLLLIGGEGPLKIGLAKLIEDLNLKDHIKLLGYIEQGRMILYYQAADLFILPSRALEGFGIVTLEALSCGLPVLGTPVGGTIEILNRLDSNLLFKDTSAGSMAELILKFLDDPSRLKETQVKCRQFALDNYSWDNSVDRTEKLFFWIKR